MVKLGSFSRTTLTRRLQFKQLNCLVVQSLGVNATGGYGPQTPIARNGKHIEIEPFPIVRLHRMFERLGELPKTR